jgi:hypothetical protein
VKRWTVKLWAALGTAWLLPILVYLALSASTLPQQGAVWTMVVIDFFGFFAAVTADGRYVEYRAQYSEWEYGKLQAENEQLKNALVVLNLEKTDAVR